MTPIKSFTDINHLLGSQLHSVDNKQANTKPAAPQAPVHSSSVVPEDKPAANNNLNTTNIADKVTLISLQNDSDEQGRDQDHEDNDDASVNTGSTLLFAANKQSTLESNINFTTKEGDTVSLNFSRATSYEQSYTSGDGGFAYASSSTSSVALNIAIEGNLNKDEQKSIVKLVEKIDEIVDKFYNRETQDALHKIEELNLKSQDLGQFSFNFQQSTTQTALIAYQTVDNFTKQLPDKKEGATNKAINPVAKGAELVNDIKAATQEIDEVLEQKNPFDTLIGIFNEINKVKQPEPIGMQQGLKDFAKFIKEIFKDMEDDKEHRQPQPVSEIVRPTADQSAILQPVKATS